jgi:hypothetical protein
MRHPISSIDIPTCNKLISMTDKDLEEALKTLSIDGGRYPQGMISYTVYSREADRRLRAKENDNTMEVMDVWLYQVESKDKDLLDKLLALGYDLHRWGPSDVALVWPPKSETAGEMIDKRLTRP